MNHLELDFVAPPQAGALLRWAMLALGAGLIAAQLTYWIVQLQPMQSRLSETLTSQGKSLRKPASTDRLTQQDFAKLLLQAREVDQQITLPWNDLFVFLDHASGKNLALMALEPDTSKGQLVITAEARDFAAMLDFYAAVQGSPLFSEVALQSHVINQNVPEQPIRFRLRAHWLMRP